MFWGLMLDEGKRYTQVVDHSFMVTMAALEPSHPPGSEANPYVSVMIEYSKVEYMLCSLQHGHCLQCPLTLQITEGEEITFFFEGRGTVHMTGYLIMDDEFSLRRRQLQILDETEEVISEQDSEEASVEEDASSTVTKLQDLVTGKDNLKDSSDEDNENWRPTEVRRKIKPVSKTTQGASKPVVEAKKRKLQTKDDDASLSSSSSDNKDSDESAGELCITSDEADPNPATARSVQNGKSTQIQPTTPEENQEASVRKKTRKTSSSSGPEVMEVLNSTLDKNKATVKKKRKLASGVVIRDLNIGEGLVAKYGRLVSVFYKGWLPKKGNREFDSCLSGKPYTFSLGKGNVIKGLDEGVKGMKLKGKRRIFIPSKLGYGRKGVDQEIPPNSPLVFEVELVKVKQL